MTGAAVLDAADFEVGRQLSANLATFRRESERLTPDDFVPFPAPHLYTDGWLVCMLVLRWGAVPDVFRLQRNRLLCPESVRILESSPSIQAAAFSRLLPGCRIHVHEDRPAAGILRYHAILRSHTGATLNANGSTIALDGPRELVFDHSLPHAAENASRGVRDALVADFVVADDEAATLRHQRGGVNLGPTASPLTGA